MYLINSTIQISLTNQFNNSQQYAPNLRALKFDMYMCMFTLF